MRANGSAGERQPDTAEHEHELERHPIFAEHEARQYSDADGDAGLGEPARPGGVA